MILHTPKRRRLVISLTPLIDVVFILLVFFMLASSFANWRSYDLATTTDNAQANATEKDPITISLYLPNNGPWLLDGQPLTAAHTLHKALQSHDISQLTVLIQPEANVAVQITMDALDAVKRAGVQTVSLQTPPAESAP